MSVSTPFQACAATRCAVVRRVQGVPPAPAACGHGRPVARTVTGYGPALDGEEKGERLLAWWKQRTSGQDNATEACLCRSVGGYTVKECSTKHSRMPH